MRIGGASLKMMLPSSTSLSKRSSALASKSSILNTFKISSDAVFSRSVFDQILQSKSPKPEVLIMLRLEIQARNSVGLPEQS